MKARMFSEIYRAGKRPPTQLRHPAASRWEGGSDKPTSNVSGLLPTSSVPSPSRLLTLWALCPLAGLLGERHFQSEPARADVRAAAPHAHAGKRSYTV